MPGKQLQQTLDALHQQLESTDELGGEDRAALAAAIEDIRSALSSSDTEPPAEGALGRHILALIEDLETSHPKLADMLRNLSESLANLGI